MVALTNLQIIRTITLLIIIFSLRLPAYAKYSGGTGEPNDPYQIATAEDLMLLGDSPEDYYKHFIMTDNIDMDPNLPGGKDFDWAVVYWSWFKGVFDGNGRVIKNLQVPLFSEIDIDGKVRKLGISDVHINMKDDAARYTGGLAIINRGTIEACYVQGEITCSGTAGGLVGNNEEYGTISDCYASVVIKGAQTAGGLVGSMDGRDIQRVINRCYSTSRFSEDFEETLLPLIGWQNFIKDGRVVDSYFLSDSNSNSTGGTPLIESQMQVQDTFQRWDFHGNEEDGLRDIWFMPQDSYPVLSWQTDVTGLKSIPNIHSYTSHNAEYILIQSDFTIGKTERHPHNTIPVDHSLFTIPWGVASAAEPLTLVVSDGPYNWTENEGMGSEDNPYRISTAEQLLSISNDPNLLSKYIMLVNDIDLAPNLLGGKALDRPVIPISYREESYGRPPVKKRYVKVPFTGTFSGNGFAIRNMTIIGWGEINLGLFSEVGDGGSIINLRLEKANIIGGSNSVGLLAGYNKGNITNCSVTGFIQYDWEIMDVGGLVGFNEGSISRCCSINGEITVPKGTRVGGLVGANGYNNNQYSVILGGAIIDCYSSFKVTAFNEYDSLIGHNNGLIKRCYRVGGTPNTDGWDFYGNYDDGFLDTWFMPQDSSNDYPPVVLTWQTEFSGLREIPDYNPEYELYPTWRNRLEIQGFAVEEVNEYSNMPDGWITRISPSRYIPEDQAIHIFISKGRYDWSDAGGNGTQSDPFEVNTIDQLQALDYFVEKGLGHYFVLANNLNLGDRILSEPLIRNFAGTLDGNGHVISKLQIWQQEEYMYQPYRGEPRNIGLFGRISGSVMNLSLENIIVKSNWEYCGGLTGINEGTIETCSVSGKIVGSQAIGGLVGSNGMLWIDPDPSIIINCYSSCSVIGDKNTQNSTVGGLAGLNLNGSITTSYSTGTVSGDKDVGGLVGNNSDHIYKGPSLGKTISSFWDVETSGQADSAGGTGLSTSEMQTANTFLEAGWDFVEETANGTDDIWWILEGQDYPKLWWELGDEASP